MNEEYKKAINKNADEISKVVREVKSVSDLEQLKNKLIGKFSQISELRKSVGKMDESSRQQAGQILNEAIEVTTQIYESRLMELKKQALLNEHCFK